MLNYQRVAPSCEPLLWLTDLRHKSSQRQLRRRHIHLPPSCSKPTLQIQSKKTWKTLAKTLANNQTKIRENHPCTAPYGGLNSQWLGATLNQLSCLEGRIAQGIFIELQPAETLVSTEAETKLIKGPYFSCQKNECHSKM